jgi:glycosyltransferase involved in cell wall biosynthesis
MKKLVGRKLDIIANDGSPLGVTSRSIWGSNGRFGVGGAELAILTLCEGWQARGYDVTFYNNPDEGGASPFTQKTLNEFDPNEDRDYLIIFRSPNERVKHARGKKIWFSCDQFTLGDFKKFSEEVEKIVTISPFHANYFREMYGISETITIDLPVRVNDYKAKSYEKVSKKCIYTSVPDRGSVPLRAIWALIVREVPDAQLVLTSDWRLWNPEIDQSVITPWKLPYAMLPNVSYIGAVHRDELIRHQLEADLLLYPNLYDELFCIAVAEAQVAGAIPVTSRIGAVETTNEFGTLIHGHPTETGFVDSFVEWTVRYLQDPDLRDRQIEMQGKAEERFSLDRILAEWETRVFS